MKFFKIALIVLGVLVLLVIVGVGFVFISSNAALNKEYDVAITPIEIPTDEESIQWGRHLAITRGCADCHGADMGGGHWLQMGPIAGFAGVNITPGPGSVVENYSDADYVRAIRHGIKENGKSVIAMPSYEYYYLSDKDLGSLIAYLKSLPPVAREVDPPKVGPVGHLMHVMDEMKLIASAEYIPHDAPRPPAPEPAITVAYGEYVSKTCIGCHGDNLSGGVSFGPDVPVSSNLTHTGMNGYNEDKFMQLMRTGERPDGRMIDSFMPWRQFAAMNETELKALWVYLEQLEPLETGS